MQFEQLLVHINETMHRSIQRFKQEAIGRSAHSDVTIAQLAYVEAIFRLGRPTLTGLAEELRISKASTSTGVHKLIHRGLAAAERSKDDKRVIYITLTAKGRKLIEAETAAFRELSARIRRALTAEEIGMLEGILAKITGPEGV